ncbi:hypothetical protein GCM10020256_14990 [Streptomyces thermocoprophilus]
MRSGPLRSRGAKNAAARKKLIAALRDDRDGALLYAEFEAAKRRAEGESHFLRVSERFPLTGRGDINTYAVFTESNRTLTGPRGRTGGDCADGDCDGCDDTVLLQGLGHEGTPRRTVRLRE